MLFAHYRVVATIILFSGLAACSSDPNKTVRRPTLAELTPFSQSQLVEADVVTAAQLQRVYQDLLALGPAAAVRQKVLYRLSQLNTRQLELAELSPGAEQQALQQLIAEYQALIAEFPADPNNELIRYQLARSFDLVGDSVAAQQQMQLLLQHYPKSDFAAELWFRIGDIYYSQAFYPDALSAFEQVLTLAGPELRQHALYMSGWSHFQLQQYPAADDAFLQALDLTYHQRRSADQQQSLREELQRVLSISLSYQQQATSLLALLKRAEYRAGPAAQRPVAYQAGLFQALADFLFEKELDQAALQSYRLFIDDQPLALEAARMQLKLVQYYLDYANATAAEQAQQDFIGRFGPVSAFWQQARPLEQAELAPQLAQYLDYFGRAGYQQVQQASAEGRRAVYAALVQYWQQLLLVQPLLATDKLDDSLLWPDDVRYLLAEALAGSADKPAALALYQQLGYPTRALVARSFSSEQAAYQALLLSGELAATPGNTAEAATAANARWWQQQHLFVREHSTHPQAQQVALNQLAELYQQQQYAEIKSYARRVTDWPHPEHSQQKLVTQAWFIVSQTELAQGDYRQAEQSIQRLLNGDATQNTAATHAELSSSRRQLLQQQLASAVYQQAQYSELTAAEQLSNLARLLRLPASDYHQPAAYQQIAISLEQQAWPEAIKLMQAYQQQYPDSAEQAAISTALLNSYEQLQDWQSAADMLSKQLAQLPAGDAQRQLLYRMADYYWQANNSEAARLAYRSYANQYSEPHLPAQEAHARLVQLYQADNDISRRNFWYQRTVSAEQASTTGTDRSRYLAAEAALQLGLHEAMLFNAITLKQPLRANLQKKQTHMTAAIQVFQASMTWQVAEFYSQAQYQVARLYQQMAAALLHSERPAGLEPLALEQYELLLEEQAYPFEELAIDIYQQNAALVTQPLYDRWVADSFSKLAELFPARYRKPEVYLELADEAY
jgi:TolA-binding protein